MSASRFEGLVGRLQPFLSHQFTCSMNADIHQRLAIILKVHTLGKVDRLWQLVTSTYRL